MNVSGRRWFRRPSKRLLSCVALVLLARPASAQRGRLSVVLPTAPPEFHLTRGNTQIEELKVQNVGNADIAVESILFDYRSEPGQQPPQLMLPAVLGLNGMTLGEGQTTTLFVRFPAYPSRAEYKGELYLKRAGVAEQPEPFHSFSIRIHEPLPRPWSRLAAGFTATGFGVLALLLTALVRPKGKNFFQSPDPGGTYSVSRFQVWLWTVVIVFSYGYLNLRVGPEVAFPDSIWALLGISVASISVATTVAVRKDKEKESEAKAAAPTPPATGATPAAPPPSAKVRPGPLTSMLSDPDGHPSIMRLQMFVWTAATVFFFLRQVFATSTMWDVPSSLLILMGISHTGYLLDKGAAPPK